MHDQGAGGHPGQLHVRPARHPDEDPAAGGAGEAGGRGPPQPHRPARRPVPSVLLPVDEQLAAARAAPHRHHPALGHLLVGDRGLQQVPPLRVRRLPNPLEAGSPREAGLPGDPPLCAECADREVERQGHQPPRGRGLPAQVYLCRRPQPPARLSYKDDIVISVQQRL